MRGYKSAVATPMRARGGSEPAFGRANVGPPAEETRPVAYRNRAVEPKRVPPIADTRRQLLRPPTGERRQPKQGRLTFGSQRRHLGAALIAQSGNARHIESIAKPHRPAPLSQGERAIEEGDDPLGDVLTLGS
jgi:hypothetical protein